MPRIVHDDKDRTQANREANARETEVRRLARELHAVWRLQRAGAD
jgi:hypothetical protein